MPHSVNGPMAVSYTHLDVYKRQTQHRGDGPFPKRMFFRPLLPRRSAVFMVIPILVIRIDQNEVGVGFVEIIIHGESSFIIVLHLIVPIYWKKLKVNLKEYKNFEKEIAGSIIFSS